MKNFIAISLAALTLAASASTLAAQSGTELQRISDLEQDVQALNEKIGHLNIQMEAIQRENDALKAKLTAAPAPSAGAAPAGATYVTTTQLDAQLANLRAEMMRAQTAQKDEIVDEVGRQMERLAQQTQQAIAQAQPVENAPKTSDNVPKTGFSYTVEKGDTLSRVASKFGVTVAVIMEANSLTSDKIKVGDKLFIPQKTTKPSLKR